MINYNVKNYRVKNVYLDNDELVLFQDTADTLYELGENLEDLAENDELKGENGKITKAELMTAKKVLYMLAENDDIIIKREK